MKSKQLMLSLLILFVATFYMCQNTKSKVTKSDPKEKLIGVWGPSINENASFRVMSDSIYYPESFKSYKYSTNNDSIFIHYDSWIFKGTFCFRNDSLILKAQGKENVFIRIQNNK